MLVSKMLLLPLAHVAGTVDLMGKQSSLKEGCPVTTTTVVVLKRTHVDYDRERTSG